MQSFQTKKAMRIPQRNCCIGQPICLYLYADWDIPALGGAGRIGRERNECVWMNDNTDCEESVHDLRLDVYSLCCGKGEGASSPSNKGHGPVHARRRPI